MGRPLVAAEPDAAGLASHLGASPDIRINPNKNHYRDMPTLKEETKEEVEAVREARANLEEAVEDIPDEDALFEAAQLYATFPPTTRDEDRRIAQRYQEKLETLNQAVFDFRQALRDYENAFSDFSRRRENLQEEVR